MARSRGLITAESLAIATGLGYALAFLYELGLVAYYLVPAESIRVSPEWVIFIALALAPGVLGYITGATAADWLTSATARQQVWVRSALVLVGLVLGFLSSVFGRIGSILLVVSMLLLSLGFSSWLVAKRQQRSTQRAARPYFVALRLMCLMLAVVFGVVMMGAVAARSKHEYLVDVEKERVLVYSTDTVYVFADYDPKTAQLKPTLTYVSSGDFGKDGLTLVSVNTGRLKSAVAGQ